MVDWQSIWNWLSDSDTQRTLGFVGASIAAIVSAVWVVFTYFHKKHSEEQPLINVKADRGGYAAGHDMNISRPTTASKKVNKDSRSSDQEP